MELIGDYGQKKICQRSGKVMLTKREAGSQLNSLKGHRTSSHIGRGTNKPKRAYFCDYCGMYHVTHLAQSKGNSVRHATPYKRQKNYNILDGYYNEEYEE